ncbi:hypothetical protein Tco_0615490 [Tanacetum coccineum]
MEYLPQRRWSSLEKKRAHIMIKAIDKQLKERRMMKRFEKFVGGRHYRTDLRMSYCVRHYKVTIDNPNITMEEYIRLEEKKARRHGKVFNWETAKYGRIWYDEDVHDLRSVETEFLVIVFNDTLTSEATLSCEPTVSSLNDNEIDFRISFDESKDEDYTVIYDKNSVSYKIISANDLKTDSENDNEKVNMPSFPSPELTVSCFDDLDFFKDFENEFPAIVYNDALTSKSDFNLLVSWGMDMTYRLPTQS